MCKILVEGESSLRLTWELRPMLKLVLEKMDEKLCPPGEVIDSAMVDSAALSCEAQGAGVGLKQGRVLRYCCVTQPKWISKRSTGSRHIVSGVHLPQPTRWRMQWSWPQT